MEAVTMSRNNQTVIRTRFGSSCSSFATRIGAMILIAAAVALPSPSVAVEGGGTLWFMGSAGFGAGVIPEPGFHLGNLTYITETSLNQEITMGDNEVTDLDLRIGVNAMTPVYTGEIVPWGARYKLLAFIPLVWIDGEYQVKGEKNVDGSANADIGDIGFEATIGWREKSIIGVDGLNFDYATGLLVVAPTGKYDSNAVLNAGKNRWMIQPNFSYTLFHEATGIEVSQRFMYAFNSRNEQTKYNSGQEFHFDWAAGKRFDFGLTAGLFGFWYRQTTNDHGRGATTGNLKGRAWGIGPMLQYSGEVLGVPASATVRYQKVFQHYNRTDDDSIWFQVAVSF
jgi:hypothetical protein